MLPGYQAKINLGVGIGVVMVSAGRYWAASDPRMVAPATLVSLLGAVFFVYGTCMYAKAKGYHWALGFIGLFFCIGLLILVLMPDKMKFPPAAHGFEVMPPQFGPPGPPPRV